MRNKLQKLKAKDVNWINERLENYGKQLDDWKNFYTFECSHFFRSHYTCEINIEKYTRATNFIYRKIRQLELLKKNKGY